MSDRVLRERQNNASQSLDRSSVATPQCSAAMVVQTFTQTTYPTTPENFYACHPGIITGDETEGATPTFTFDSDTTIYCLNTGTAIPPSGTKLVAHLGSGRWTFRFDG